MPLNTISRISDDTTALLIRARGFVERGWCRYAAALDAHGHVVDPSSESAVAWCAFGALIAAGIPLTSSSGMAIRRRLLAAIGIDSITLFNDAQKSVEPVLAAFDRAIATGPLP